MNNSGLIPTEGKNNGCGHVCRLVLWPYVTCWHQTLPSDLFRRNRLDQTEQDVSTGSSVTLIAPLDNSSVSVRKDTYVLPGKVSRLPGIARLIRADLLFAGGVHTDPTWLVFSDLLSFECVTSQTSLSTASRPNEPKSDLDHLWTFFSHCVGPWPVLSDWMLLNRVLEVGNRTQTYLTGRVKFSVTLSACEDKRIRWHFPLSHWLSWQGK